MSRAFTLVELLIVIAIIAILASIAVPQYTKYVKKAAAVNVQSTYSACLAAAQAAFADNGTKEYSCKINADDTDTVTIYLDEDGRLKDIKPLSLTIRGHKVACTPIPEAEPNVIICDPAE